MKNSEENSYQQQACIYNRAVPIKDILTHYGWRHYREHFWTEPGKKSGVSASVAGDKMLPLTNRTILESDRIYNAFELLAQYEFDGDKLAAARALRRQEVS